MQTQTKQIESDYQPQSDAVRNWISKGIQIPVNIHQLRGDEYGFVASNRPPITLGNSRNSFHEGWGRFEGEALQDLAQITGIPQKAFTIAFRG